MTSRGFALRAGRAVLSAAISASFLFGGLLTVSIIADPAPAEAKTSGAPVTEFMLKNGMKVVVIEDHRAPVVTHMVWYKVGAADEPPGASGIAHFLEHLMFKGTDKIAPGDFSKIIARNGGQDNAFTSQDVTAYFQRVAKDRLPLVMDMEADRMANLKLLEKDVLTERNVVLEERRSRVENRPGSLMDEQMRTVLYQSHPYRNPVIGWMHEIAELSLDEAVAHYKKFYGPNNAILIVAGDVTPAEVKELAVKTYGKVKPVPSIVERVRPQEPPSRAARRVTLKDKRAGNASFSRYYIAPSYQSAKPGEAEALDLMMKVVGASAIGRLYREIVVDKKIATSVSGYYSGGGRDYGNIGIFATAAKGHTLDEIEVLIDQVLADIRKNGVTQKELDRARSSYIASHIYGNDSQAGLARRYGFALAIGGTIEDVESWPDELKKVTLDDIKAVAVKYLDPRGSVTGHLLPVDETAVEKAEGDADAPSKS